MPDNTNAESKMETCLGKPTGRSNVRDPEGWVTPKLLPWAPRLERSGPQRPGTAPPHPKGESKKLNNMAQIRACSPGTLPPTSPHSEGKVIFHVNASRSKPTDLRKYLLEICHPFLRQLPHYFKSHKADTYSPSREGLSLPKATEKA